ncbi:organic cation/carnitine transporter 7-like [Melia azedarach]|uniref:Organic cation/carnitine transporter 7-like n=1 Tax=Melia azedarach TaxID=155640 RepID=A0ACC1XCW8_MELAZ|nr:organic cation/carnitine transporter 7-like [Melia azedarach]
MDDQSQVYTLDDALTFMGFGKFQGLALVCSGLAWFGDSMEIMILSFVGTAVGSQWRLSSSEESIITTVVFAGMLVGAYSWGLISDNYGRRKSMLGGAMVISVTGLLSALSPNYTSLVILRGVTGTGLGCGQVFFSWFLEFVPPSNRGMWMTIFATFGTLGSVSEAALAWIVMPRLNWRWLLALSTVPSCILLILTSFMPESPRYLLTKGRITDAHNILENIALFNRASLPSGSLISDRTTKLGEEFATSEETPLLTSTTNKTTELKSGCSSFLMLFSPRLFRTTILLWILYFGNAFIYYGIVLLTSSLSSTQSKCNSSTLLSENVRDANLYLDLFITGLAELPGLLLAAIIVDRVGRKPSMIIMNALLCIFLLPLFTHQSNILTTALLAGARMCCTGNYTITNIFSPEIYPTSMRSTGAGITYGMGRIGAMICPLVAVGLVTSCHKTAAIILLEAVIFVSVVSILLIPFETKGKELTDTIDGVSTSKQVSVVG